jgi:hypothetical protein
MELAAIVLAVRLRVTVCHRTTDQYVSLDNVEYALLLHSYL